MSAGSQTKHYLRVNDGPKYGIKGAIFDEVKTQPNTILLIEAREHDNYRLSETVVVPTVNGPELDELIHQFETDGYTRKGTKSWVKFIQTKIVRKEVPWE